MSISDILRKIKGQDIYSGEVSPGFSVFRHIHRLYLPGIVILVGIASFSIGRLSVLPVKKSAVVYSPVALTALSVGAHSKNSSAAQQVPINGSVESTEEVIASKSGTKYYLPWCAAAARIKPENIVRFSSPEAARAAGYLPASNCSGTR